LKNRSTSTNLAIVTDFTATELDKGGRADIVYTGFSKAFDLVDHDVLLSKLKFFNFSTGTLKLLTSYLR